MRNESMPRDFNSQLELMLSAGTFNCFDTKPDASTMISFWFNMFLKIFLPDKFSVTADTATMNKAEYVCLLTE